MVSLVTVRPRCHAPKCVSIHTGDGCCLCGGCRDEHGDVVYHQGCNDAPPVAIAIGPTPPIGALLAGVARRRGPT